MEYSDYELVYMVKENEEALEYLLKKYEPLFRKLACSFAFKCKNIGMDTQDIIQYCRIVFCRAIDLYNPDREVLFFSYLIVCLKKSVIRYINRYANKALEISSIDINEYDNLGILASSYDAFENYNEYEMDENIRKFQTTLTIEEGRVFELRYNGFSYKDIAMLLEIDLKKVDNVLVKVRKKLEKYFLFS